MNFLNNPERERIIKQALNARTPPEITGATRALDQWVRDHPDDPSIRDAYEMLSLMQDSAEEENVERTYTASNLPAGKAA